mmetsp:Transcript_43557/g.145105  ORF Transcript_43557/g.145105 Transcript_43557/m.145105 type:complete len:214 (+) Transcript_43557:1853-2494(+)
MAPARGGEGAGADQGAEAARAQLARAERRRRPRRCHALHACPARAGPPEGQLRRCDQNPGCSASPCRTNLVQPNSRRRLTAGGGANATGATEASGIQGGATPCAHPGAGARAREAATEGAADGAARGARAAVHLEDEADPDHPEEAARGGARAAKGRRHAKVQEEGRLPRHQPRAAPPLRLAIGRHAQPLLVQAFGAGRARQGRQAHVHVQDQ